jgi:hypothetical protein
MRMNACMGGLQCGELAAFMRMNGCYLEKELFAEMVTLSEQNWVKLSECQGADEVFHGRTWWRGTKGVGNLDKTGVSAHTVRRALDNCRRFCGRTHRKGEGKARAGKNASEASRLSPILAHNKLSLS